MRSATAEIVIEPGVRGWLVRIHWPRWAPTKLSFSTEQAARNWAKTASSDWIANHPRHGRPQSRLNQGCEREKSNVNVRPCTDVSEHRRTNIAPASASSLKKRSRAPISLPKGGGLSLFSRRWDGLGWYGVAQAPVQLHFSTSATAAVPSRNRRARYSGSLQARATMRAPCGRHCEDRSSSHRSRR